jgi:Outer membrane protein and related peptidoglycan-associated (lipo)proteins
MKKEMLVGFLSLFIAISTFGQGNSVAQTKEKAVRMDTFKDNWFFQVQAGPSFTFSDGFKDASFGDIISPHVALSIGKHFAPTVGARLQLGAWQSKNYLPARDNTYTRNYIQVSGDGMLNLTNLFCTYTYEKKWNLYALLGAAYVHTFKKDGYGVTNSIVPRAGLQLDYRITDRVGINLEAMGNLMNEDFDGRAGGTKYDGTLNVLVGASFKLGKKSFDVVDVADPAEINRLANEIRSQKSLVSEREATIQNKNREISDLQAKLNAKPNVVVQEPIEEVVMNAVVVFRLGSAALQDNQEINIYNAAKYFQENPKMNIIITGYADKSTGSAAVNQRLSEQRADAVKKIMVSKYKIDASRITTQGSGDKVQPFASDAWNRVAIFTAVPGK